MESQNLYIATESANVSQSGDQAGRFKVLFPSYSISRTDDQDIRLSVQQFNMARNFYLCNASNSQLRLVTLKPGIQSGDKNDEQILNIRNGDYQSIMGLAHQFAQSVGDGIVNVSATAGIAISTIAVNTTIESENFSGRNSTKGSNGTLPADKQYFNAPVDRILDVEITFSAAHGYVSNDICLQTVHNSTTTPVLLDTHALLGSIRVEADEPKESDPPNAGHIGTLTRSFTVTTPSPTKIKIVGHYPMQLQTQPYLYLKTDNIIALESASLQANAIHDNQMLSSTILAKIPVGYYNCRINENTMVGSSKIDVRELSSLLFKITDHRDRVITDFEANPNQSKDGNLYCDFTIRVDKLTVPRGFNRLEVSQKPAPFTATAPENQQAFVGLDSSIMRKGRF